MLGISACELLDQLSLVIKSCKENDFSKPLPELSNATVGQHIRHTLEFFLCLFDAKNTGLINYDNRKHDKVLETDPRLAQSMIFSVKSFLQNQREDFAVTFEANYTLDKTAIKKMSSSFYRELAYNIEHAIHHMALIKVAVNQTLTYINLPDNFGVASSTIRYRADVDA